MTCLLRGVSVTTVWLSRARVSRRRDRTHTTIVSETDLRDAMRKPTGSI
jgi:hypothetical protein